MDDMINDIENESYVSNEPDDRESLFIFDGNLSEKNRRYLRSRNIRTGVIIGLISAIFIAVVLIVFMPVGKFLFIIVPFGMVVMFVFWLVFMVATCPKKLKIEIFDDWIDLKIDDAETQGTFTNDIVKITDVNDSYYIKFASKFPLCICQKDSIVKGEIEQFADKFGRYIERE